MIAGGAITISNVQLDTRFNILKINAIAKQMKIDEIKQFSKLEKSFFTIC